MTFGLTTNLKKVRDPRGRCGARRRKHHEQQRPKLLKRADMSGLWGVQKFGEEILPRVSKD
jgi:hypothetical protein